LNDDISDHSEPEALEAIAEVEGTVDSKWEGNYEAGYYVDNGSIELFSHSPYDSRGGTLNVIEELVADVEGDSLSNFTY